MAAITSRQYGYKDVRRLVFRETFTGNGSATTFQLTSNVGNVTFVQGGWEAADIQNTLPGHATKTNKKNLYDSANPITRNKIEVSSISAAGLVTLNYAPQSENFYIWYWYELDAGDTVDDYYREEFVASMEMEQGTLTASSINTDTSNFNALLSASDDTVQKALDTLDDHLHQAQTITPDGITPDSGTLTITGATNITGAVGITGTTTVISQLNIGVDDTQSGSIHIFGHATGSDQGGAIYFYNPDDDDGTVEYYIAQAFNGQFRLGADIDNLYMTMATDGQVDFRAGTVVIGVADTQSGTLQLSGHATTSTQGGELVIDTAADHDTTINSYNIQAYEDDLYIGPSTDEDLIKIDSNKDVYITDGDLYIQNPSDNIAQVFIGQNDNHVGFLTLYGGGSGEEGGTLLLYTDADNDGTIEYWAIQNQQSVLWIGPSNDADAFKLTYTAGTSVGVEFGANDNTPAWLYLYGGSANNDGGRIYIYTNAADDATIEYYNIIVEIDDLLIGPSTNANALKYDGTNNTFVVEVDTFLATSGGDVYIGANDTVDGNLHIYGDTTGSDLGGRVRLHTAADHDTSIDYYQIFVSQDDLLIGPSTNTDKFQMMADDTVRWDMQAALMEFQSVGNINHQATSLANAATYGTLSIANSSQGGLVIRGFREDGGAGANTAIQMQALSDQDVTTKTNTGALAKVIIDGADSIGGGSYGNLSLDSNVLSVRARYGGAWRYCMTVDSDGDLFVNGDIAWYGDTDTFIDHPAADQIAVVLGGTQYVTFNATSVGIGVGDTTYGLLSLNGDGTTSTQGGKLKLHTAADHDTTIDYYAVDVYEDDLYIGPATNPNSLYHSGATSYWYFEDGQVFIGNQGTSAGYLYLAGTGVGAGGQIYIYFADDSDSTIDHWRMQGNNEQLLFGPDTDTDLFTFTVNKDLIFTDGDLILRNPSDSLALLTVGQDGNHRGQVDVYGDPAGSNAGGIMRLYIADDYDTTAEYWNFEAYQNDLWIGPSNDLDAVVFEATGYLRCSVGLYLGYNDSVSAPLYLYGAATATGGTMYIYNAGDSDGTVEYWQFGSASGSLTLGPNTDTGLITITPTEIVFNENSNDIDFRVESNGSANMLFVDGGNDRVGIDIAAPTAKLHLPAVTTAVGTAPLKFDGGGTLLTTPESGALEYADDRLYLTNVAVRRAFDRSSDVITSTTTVTNTTVETTIWTGTLEVAALKVGNMLEAVVSGVITNATAADDITIRAYMGANLLTTYNPAIGNVTNEPWFAEQLFTVRSLGAAGSVAVLGHTQIGTTAEVVDSNIVTVDTTVATDITVTAQWNNAKAGNIISIYQGVLGFKN